MMGTAEILALFGNEVLKTLEPGIEGTYQDGFTYNTTCLCVVWGDLRVTRIRTVMLLWRAGKPVLNESPYYQVVIEEANDQEFETVVYNLMRERLESFGIPVPNFEVISEW